MNPESNVTIASRGIPANSKHPLLFEMRPGADLLLPRVRPEEPIAQETESSDLNERTEIRTHRASKEMRKLAKHALELGLHQIGVEEPVTWINGTKVGESCRLMFSGLVLSLGQLGLPVMLTPTDKASSFSQRNVPADQILFSYHSAGKEDGNWRIKESYLPPYFTCDRTGFSGWAELAHSRSLFELSEEIDTAEAALFHSQLLTRIRTENLSKYAQPQSSGVPIQEPYVFYAMQIATDTVMEHARIKYDELLPELVRLAEENNKPLVIKRHPLCKDKRVAQLLQVAQQSKNVTITEASVQDVIAGAESVVVINSGVGMESVIQGKPVFTAGTSEYRWATYEIERLEQLREAFLKPAPKLDQESLARFVTFYFRDYCIDASNMRSVERHVARALRHWIKGQEHDAVQ